MEKMTDDQWLRGMSKYSGIDHRLNREGEFVGGEHQIAVHLQSYAQKYPARFIALSDRYGGHLILELFRTDFLWNRSRSERRKDFCIGCLNCVVYQALTRFAGPPLWSIDSLARSEGT